MGSPGAIAYGAGKGGVFGFTNVAARDLASHGITVNGVNPSSTETRMVTETIDEFAAKGGQQGEIAKGLLAQMQKPENVAAFIEATRANHEGSVREPGNRRFDILQDPEDSTQFILYEAYASAADAAAHKETPHYLAWRDTVAEMMAVPRQGVPQNCLFPKD